MFYRRSKATRNPSRLSKSQNSYKIITYTFRCWIVIYKYYYIHFKNKVNHKSHFYLLLCEYNHTFLYFHVIIITLSSKSLWFIQLTTKHYILKCIFTEGPERKESPAYLRRVETPIFYIDNFDYLYYYIIYSLHTCIVWLQF